VNNFLETRSHAFILARRRFDYVLWKLGLRPYYFPQVFYKRYSPSMEERWQYTKTILTELAVLAAEHNARVALVIIPTNYQAYPEMWETYLKIYNVAHDSVDIVRPQRILKAFGKEKGIPVLDLLPEFRRVGNQKELYFKIDGHWNKEGNKLAAEAISRFLVREGLVPQN